MKFLAQKYLQYMCTYAGLKVVELKEWLLHHEDLAEEVFEADINKLAGTVLE